MVVSERTDYMTEARERYALAKSQWSNVRADYTADARFASGNPAQQWDEAVKSAKDDAGDPALTFDTINPLVQSIVNKARKDQPQPKITPGDEGDPETAEVLEGKLRHLQYASHAGVARGHAMFCATVGGWGFYKITKDYCSASPKCRDKEPKYERILDPMTSFPDPGVQEPDFSDAMWWFLRKKYNRKVFKAEFGVEPMSFPFEEDKGGDWGDKENVWAAEYYWVEIKKRRHLILYDGTDGFEDEIDPQYKLDDGQIPPEFITSERMYDERVVHLDIIDGEKILEENILNCEWIPIIAVLGQETVVEGVRRFVSAIRYMAGPQKFRNASFSGLAAGVGEVNRAEWIGRVGQFRDGKWNDNKRHKYYEYSAPVGTAAGAEFPPPFRDTAEVPIQALMQTAMLSTDGVKAAIGYVDSISRPSQADISGVAVTRRTDQAQLANWQFQANLNDALWHEGRVALQMLIRETDTPRKWQVRKEDDTQMEVPVIGGDQPGMVPGYEGQKHHQVDKGDYNLIVTVGPAYSSKMEEEADEIIEVMKANPQMMPLYLDLYFKKRGYTDLAERAQLALPPELQQAITGKQQGVSPREQQLQAQVAQMQAVIKDVVQKLQTKQIETEGKLEVQKLKTQGDLEVGRMDLIKELLHVLESNKHDAAKHLSDKHHSSIAHILDLGHAEKMATDSNALQTSLAASKGAGE